VKPTVLGARIREARESVRMSQEELASLVHKDQRAISEYENGKRKLSATDVPVFANALNVPILYFYEDEVSLDDFDRAMLAELQRLPTSETKLAAIELVRVLSRALQLPTT
jgi:transcriptional regulator with XRE-family HTH domain